LLIFFGACCALAGGNAFLADTVMIASLSLLISQIDYSFVFVPIIILHACTMLVPQLRRGLSGIRNGRQLRQGRFF
jgi:hypothetical protein